MDARTILTLIATVGLGGGGVLLRAAASYSHSSRLKLHHLPLHLKPNHSIIQNGKAPWLGEGSFDRCWRIDPLRPRHSINKHVQPHPICVFISLTLTISINLSKNIKCLAENVRKNYNCFWYVCCFPRGGGQ